MIKQKQTNESPKKSLPKWVIIVAGVAIVLGAGLLLLKLFAQLSPAKLEAMTDSQLATLAYATSEEDDDFVTANEKDYLLIYDSADSAEDAIAKTEASEIGEAAEVLEVSLYTETDYYYVVYRKYIAYRGTGDVTFEHYRLYFKNSVLDIENQTINPEILNNTSKIKEVFNLYTYLRYNSDSSTKLLLSEVTENEKEYLYTYYCFRTSFGDWGVSDSIALMESTTTINKQSGEFTSTTNTLRQVSGDDANNDWYWWYWLLY